MGEGTFLATLEQTYDSFDILRLDELVLDFFLTLFGALKAVFLIFLISSLDELTSFFAPYIKNNSIQSYCNNLLSIKYLLKLK